MWKYVVLLSYSRVHRMLFFLLLSQKIIRKSVRVKQVADPHQFNAVPDPACLFNAYPDPAPHQDDANLRPLVYTLQTFQGSILSLHASIVNVHGSEAPEVLL